MADQVEKIKEPEEVKEEVTYGCKHYKRKCKLISPCCEKNYICRFCHDEGENHQLDRPNIVEIECLVCSKRQDLANKCSNPECEVIFGEYFCEMCRLYDDEDKKQYHCQGCGLCRVGGRDKFFHCTQCEMCLPINLRDNHKCIMKMSKIDCPICLEDIHTSRIVSHVPLCGHLIHRPCFNDLIKAGHFACPTCGTSMVGMMQMWSKLDEEIESTPMPKEYSNLYCNVLCRDCHKESMTLFHVLGQKCLYCGSYNTVRTKGGLMKIVGGGNGGARGEGEGGGGGSSSGNNNNNSGSEGAAATADTGAEAVLDAASEAAVYEEFVQFEEEGN
ncbi:RING finger and CHY zinc finger domain-containing protein 1-like [Oratosquilla oratoria]|uniref:RING finger and CHY zinc finger domain-containing protein 1-like n=1 Tax=Oratosquilla oratoria TaxID=337810 RepID=UPI003F7733D7